MLDKLCRDSRHLEHRLASDLKREQQATKEPWLGKGSPEVVGEWQRTLEWLRQMNQSFSFQCDTFVLAAHILDRFLGLVKVHGKYLKCAATATCYMAAKLNEEKLVVPHLAAFLHAVQSNFTCSDICRMERIILEKTVGELLSPNSATFLELYFSILCANHFETLFGSDSLAYSIYRSMGSQNEVSVSSPSLHHFQGSMKALALLSCTLEKITSRWFIYIEPLAIMSGIDVTDLLGCRDIIKLVVFGIQKAAPKVRARKFLRRRALYAQRRSPLSPIVENPFENEFAKYQLRKSVTAETCADLEDVMELDSGEDVLNEELKRLRRITINELDCCSPAKRRKLVFPPCSVEFQLDSEGKMTTPTSRQPLSVL